MIHLAEEVTVKLRFNIYAIVTKLSCSKVAKCLEQSFILNVR